MLFRRFILALAVALLATALGFAAPQASYADPNTGPGGPILVVSDSANPFGLYLAEILRNEGFNYFDVVDIASLDAPTLAAHTVVVLGEMSLSGPDVTLLSDWVTGGGNLIAMRPDAQLATLLGLTSDASTLAEGYLLVDTVSQPGAGIVPETIQFHGSADLYTLAGATSLATLYSDSTTVTSDPAVTLIDVGVSGGQAAAFTYDLARSVVYTRQGNPAWAATERDGQGAIRPWELFFSTGASAGQPHYVDLDRIRVPQADEQQRLLANLILHMNDTPLPRFWYLPSGHKAAVVMTGDEHGCCDATETRLTTYASNDPPSCDVDDWECVRSTSYVYPGGTWVDADALIWQNQGFEIATHVNTSCGNWTPASLAATFTSDLASFAAQFPSISAPATQRLHCIVWSDWATQANVEFSNGIRFDTNYYYLRSGNTIANSHPGMFTGSGMPMRFAELDGTMIDVYQATTQFTDESEQSYPFTVDTVLDRAIGPEGFYGVFTANMHQDNGASSDADAIIASAQARGVPIVSSEQMLEWIDGRNDSSFDSIVWSASTLSFDITAASGSLNMRGMVPTLSSAGILTGITRDSVAISHATEIIKGIEYAFYDAESGSYVATFAPDLTGPVISALTIVTDGSGNATINWTTDEQTDSLVEYGTSPGSLTLSESSVTLATAHSIHLTGLASNTTYYFRATSVDAFLNSTTEPIGGNPAASFVTPAAVCLLDETLVDFVAGTPGVDTYVSETTDGEVILRPVEGVEFEDPTLPVEWEAVTFSSGTGVSIAGGEATVDGARVNTTALYGPGHSVEFVATFQSSANQHAGFALTTQEALWAIFSTASGGTSLQARTHNGTTFFNTDLGSATLGSAHLYRVDWNATSVDFYIDGSLVHSDTITYTDDMRPLAADSAFAASGFSVDWFRMTPHAGTASYHSQVTDSLGSTNWTSASWNASEPTSTSVSMLVRTGDTAIPDGSWTVFSSLATPGDPIGQTARYLQYRADLTTSDVSITPALEDVTVHCVPGPDIFPPQILNVVVTSAFDGTSATVTWTTDEAGDSHVDFGSNPAALLLSESSAPLVTSHSKTLTGLIPNTTYHFRITSEDGSANSSTEPSGGSPLSFATTVSPISCVTDDAFSDFTSGTPGASTYVSETSNGEIILAPIEGAELEGTALNAGWSATGGSSGTGTVTLAGGIATLNGGQIVTDAVYGPGQSIEIRGTLGASTNHHFGLGFDLSTQLDWAIFSTRNTTNQIWARSRNSGGIFTDVSLGTGFNGSPHVYRIDWNTTSIDYYIDGALMHSETITISNTMRPIASDSTGGLAMTVDWMRMRPYAASGSFESQVFDAGTSSDWDSAQWTSTAPGTTALSMLVRSGETSVPDGSWSAYASIPSSGSSVGQTGRYAQYRTDLTSGNTNETPSLESVSLECSPPTGSPVTPPTAVGDMDSLDHADSTAIDVTSNDIDAIGIDATTVTVIDGPTNGSITGVNAVTGEITYQHDGSATTSDSFTYAVNNVPGLTSNVATVSLTISPAVPPMANDDSSSPNQAETVIINVLFNDVAGGAPINPATVTVTTPPANGTIDSVNTTTGAITYTHDGSSAATDSFQYTVDDTMSLTSNAATVDLTISIPPVPPMANGDVDVAENSETIVIDVLFNDVAGDDALDPASVAITLAPSNGTIDSINTATGEITYTHDGSATTTDSFRYTVDDTTGLSSNSADVDLTIQEAPEGVPTLTYGARILVVMFMLVAGGMMLARSSRRGESS